MSIFSNFLNLFYPEICYACTETVGSGEKIVCTDCRLKLPYTNYHLLPEADNPLAMRFFGKIHVEHALAYLTFVRKGRVQNLLHNLKYKDVPEIGNMLGNWYGYELKDAGYADKFDLILPVPLHPDKLKTRGYNQASKFAEGMSKGLEIPWSDKTLIRTTASSTQTKKSRLERWENVESIFAVKNPEEITGKRILLVDDVITTGATLEASGTVLLESGIKHLSIAAIAAA